MTHGMKKIGSFLHRERDRVCKIGGAVGAGCVWSSVIKREASHEKGKENVVAVLEAERRLFFFSMCGSNKSIVNMKHVQISDRKHKVPRRL